MTSLPDWVQRGVFATNGFTIFAVQKPQKAKPPAKGIALVAANGERHSLSQCHKATLADLPNAGRFIAPNGVECVLSVVSDVALLSGSGMDRIYRVRLPGLRNAVDVDAAAQKVAELFDGVIVEGDHA